MSPGAVGTADRSQLQLLGSCSFGRQSSTADAIYTTECFSKKRGHLACTVCVFECARGWMHACKLDLPDNFLATLAAAAAVTVAAVAAACAAASW